MFDSVLNTPMGLIFPYLMMSKNMNMFFLYQGTPRANFLDIQAPQPYDAEGIFYYIMKAYSTNKDQQSKPRFIEDIIAYLVAVVVCYRYQFSLSKPLGLAFFKCQIDNIQALRFKFSKFSWGYILTQIPRLNDSLASFVHLRELRPYKSIFLDAHAVQTIPKHV